MSHPYDAILFDFDGVLIDSEPIHFACWREVLAPLGLPLEWEIYASRCIGVTDRAMLQVMAAQCDPPMDLEKLLAVYPSKKELFRRRMAACSDPFPAELKNLLGGLAREVKLAVVTSSARAEVEPVLVRGGIRDCFGALVCGGDVQRHKPDPEPYLQAASRLSASKPLVLEDSDAGMASARAAGFDALRVPTPARTAEILHEHLQRRM